MQVFNRRVIKPVTVPVPVIDSVYFLEQERATGYREFDRVA